jgi:hypothetical protein
MTKAKSRRHRKAREGRSECSDGHHHQDARRRPWEQLSGFAGKFGEYAETGLKSLQRTHTAASTDVWRASSAAGTWTSSPSRWSRASKPRRRSPSAKDVREVMEIQAGFAKNMFSAYTKEMNAQAELCMSAWRSAAKPFMAFGAK